MYQVSLGLRTTKSGKTVEDNRINGAQKHSDVRAEETVEQISILCNNVDANCSADGAFFLVRFFPGD